MKIAAASIREYCPAVPGDDDGLRELLEDVGVEVKKAEAVDGVGTVFNLELLANRGDHYCIEGVAQEARGRVGGALHAPDATALEVGEPPLPLRCEDAGCLRYTATAITIQPGGALPEEVLRPLAGAGIHSIHPAVDATNLTNAERGQPTHVFDADKLEGGITLRASRAGERAWLLFEEEPRELPEGLLVVADDAKVLAVAGVIGCEDSKVTDATTRIVIESACFDPVRVRKAGQALRVHTDSRARFERGADPTRALWGAGRIVDLLTAHAGGELQGTTGVVGSWEDPRPEITLDLAATSQFLSHPCDAALVRERLTRYGFEVGEEADGRVGVGVPPRRQWDVSNPEDLYEELARSLGYNDLPIELPASTGVRPSAAELARERAEEVLLGAGFYEVITDGFYSKTLRQRFLGEREEHPLWRHVETTNAEDKAFTLLKNNCLAQAVEVVASNARLKVGSVRVFEWTRTFHPASDGVRERPVVWAIAAGAEREPSWQEPKPPAVDVYAFKGLLGELATELRVPLRLGEAGDDPLADRLHPGRSAGVYLGEERIGVLGEVHPEVIGELGFNRQPALYLELDADALCGASPRAFGLEEDPARPPSVRNLAFGLPVRVEAREVAEVLAQGEGALVPRVDVVDLFELEQDGQPVRAVTYRLAFRNDEGATSAEAINGAVEALAAKVAAALGGRGVVQRA